MCVCVCVCVCQLTLYGDSAVDELIGVLMLLALSVPKHDLIAFHKVCVCVRESERGVRERETEKKGGREGGR